MLNYPHCAFGRCNKIYSTRCKECLGKKMYLNEHQTHLQTTVSLSQWQICSYVCARKSRNVSLFFFLPASFFPSLFSFPRRLISAIYEPSTSRPKPKSTCLPMYVLYQSVSTSACVSFAEQKCLLLFYLCCGWWENAYKLRNISSDDASFMLLARRISWWQQNVVMKMKI